MLHINCFMTDALIILKKVHWFADQVSGLGFYMKWASVMQALKGETCEVFQWYVQRHKNINYRSILVAHPQGWQILQTYSMKYTKKSIVYDEISRKLLFLICLKLTISASEQFDVNIMLNMPRVLSSCWAYQYFLLLALGMYIPYGTVKVVIPMGNAVRS